MSCRRGRSRQSDCDFCPRPCKVSPTSGPAGTLVLVRGSNLDEVDFVRVTTSQGATDVQPLPASTSRKLLFNIPAFQPPGDVIFVLVSNDPLCQPLPAFHFLVTTTPPPLCPRVTDYSPHSGPTGTTVTFNGFLLNIVSAAAFEQGGVQFPFSSFDVSADGTNAVGVLPSSAAISLGPGVIVLAGPPACPPLRLDFEVTAVCPIPGDICPSNTEAKAGDLVLLSGTNLELVSRIVFEVSVGIPVVDQTILVQEPDSIVLRIVPPPNIALPVTGSLFITNLRPCGATSRPFTILPPSTVTSRKSVPLSFSKAQVSACARSC